MAEGSLFYPIIDSHVHLYPESELESISWIPQSSPLYEQKSIDQYRDATRSSPLLAGFVAIENDRKYTLESSHTYVPEWAGPLQEVSWLSRIALGEPRPGEGHSVADSHLCLGIIPFAPIAEGPVALAKYLDGAKKAAGGAWDKIKGFRYLLQDKPDGTALQDEFIQSLQFLGRQGYSFDVCVNYHRRGKQLLSDTVGMMERVLHGVPENQQITIVLGIILLHAWLL